MGKIIMMLPSKGGVGQTFLSVALSIALSESTKEKVLLIDNCAGQFAVENSFSLSDSVAFDLSDAFKGNCKIQNTIYDTGINNLDFIPSPRELMGNISPILLGKVVVTLSKYYDYVILDTPVHFSYEFTKLLSVVSTAFIISPATPDAVFMCPQISQLLRKSGVYDIRLILNKFDKQFFLMNTTFDDLDAIIDICEAQLLGIIPYDKRVRLLSYLSQASARCYGELKKANLSDKKSAFSAIKRIALRLTGKNVVLAFS